MAENKWSFTGDPTSRAAAEALFPKPMARQFWLGVAFGIIFMALADLGDVHVCIGECDGAGYDIVGPRK